MAVSRGRSVERSRLAWLCNRLPPCWVWLPNDVSAGRGLAVAWLKRGECRKVLELGVPATVLACDQGKRCSDGGSDDRGGSPQGLAHGGGDQRGGGAAG